MGFLTEDELNKIGFAKLGTNVFISNKVSIYNPGKIRIGSNVRIDDFCILSAGEGGIDIGNYVHISCYACLIGKANIRLHDYVAISVKASILSNTNDYSGDFLPTYKEIEVPKSAENLVKTISEPVVLETHTGLGAHSVVMPGVTVSIGTAIGAMSVVYEDLNSWGIYVGNPARFVKKRSDKAYKILSGESNS